MNTFEEICRATTDAMLEQGVLRYWQHDPGQKGSVTHEGLPWAYTVGRSLHGRPELLVTGLGEAHSLQVLTELEDLDLHPDGVVTTCVGRAVLIRAEPGLLHAAYAVFGVVEALQVVIDDLDPQPLHPIGGLILTDPYEEPGEPPC